MTPNVEKFSVLTYIRKLNYFIEDYIINDSLIETRSVMKDLRDIFQRNAKFNRHCCEITKKTFRSLIGNNNNFNISTVIKLYCALFRPHMEYASNVSSSRA